MLLIDTHCHLDEEFYENRDRIIDRMKEHILITSSTNDSDLKEVVALCNQYKYVYGMVGFHPDEIDNLDNNSFLKLEETLSNPKIVAVGEIGLDYFHNKENKESQKEIFIKQIKLAQKYKKPIVIHSRDAIEDTYSILNTYLYDTKAVLHCYSGSLEMAYKFQKLGVKFGIGGVVTFKNAKKLQEIVRALPLTDILLETDSPFLTPEPYRGQTNEPYNVYYVAQKIAEIKEMKIEEVVEITSQNATSQFDLTRQI